MGKTIEKRQLAKMDKVLKELEKMPIIGIASKRSGISRSSFYRWKKKNPEFSTNVDSAMQKGVLLVNDMAETKLLAKVNEGNLTAIIFWLKYRHRAYSQRMEITATTNGLSSNEIDELSNLLFSETTFVDGQKKLMSYVVGGRLTDKFAQFILKSFTTQLKAEDVFSRKAEADIISAVVLRKEGGKS